MYSYALLLVNAVFLIGNIFVFVALVRSQRDSNAALIKQTKDFAETITGVSQPWYQKPLQEDVKASTDQEATQLVDVETLTDDEWRKALAGTPRNG